VRVTMKPEQTLQSLKALNLNQNLKTGHFYLGEYRTFLFWFDRRNTPYQAIKECY